MLFVSGDIQGSKSRTLKQQSLLLQHRCIKDVLRICSSGANHPTLPVQWGSGVPKGSYRYWWCGIRSVFFFLSVGYRGLIVIRLYTSWGISLVHIFFVVLLALGVG